MACNPPYKRGLTGQWDKCRFPGMLRQNCYDYINFDFICNKSGCNCSGSTGSGGGQVIGVSGLLLGGRRLENWFDIPFSEQPDPTTFSCDQDFLGYGTFNEAQIKELLAQAIACSFDGFAVKSGAVVCFFNDESSTDPSAVAVGPVIVNNIRFKNSTVSDGTKAIDNKASGYITHWADLGFMTAAKKLIVCVYDGTEVSAAVKFTPENSDKEAGFSIMFKENNLDESRISITPATKNSPCNFESFDHGFYCEDEYCNDEQENQKSFSKKIFSAQTTSNCNITFQLKTTGCCLEFEESTGRVYAVGSGTVTARRISGFDSKCCPDFSLLINNNKNSVTVQDGDHISVTTSTRCKCEKKTPWRTLGGFKPGPCHKGPPPTPGPLRILKNTETGVYQVQLNLNSSQNDCGCG